MVVGSLRASSFQAFAEQREKYLRRTKDVRWEGERRKSVDVTRTKIRVLAICHGNSHQRQLGT